MSEKQRIHPSPRRASGTPRSPIRLPYRRSLHGARPWSPLRQAEVNEARSSMEKMSRYTPVNSNGIFASAFLIRPVFPYRLGAISVLEIPQIFLRWRGVAVACAVLSRFLENRVAFQVRFIQHSGLHNYDTLYPRDGGRQRLPRSVAAADDKRVRIVRRNTEPPSLNQHICIEYSCL